MTRSEGFTLLELLIAMGLVSLISVLLYASLRTGALAWQSSLEMGQRAEETRLAQAFLRRVVRQCLPLEVRTERARYAHFEGSGKAMQFAGVLPAHRGIAGISELRLQAVAKGGQESIEFTSRLLRPDRNAAWHEPAVVLSGLANVNFSYYGTRNGKQAPRWQSAWRAAGRLPSLVQLRFTDAYGKPARLLLPVEVPEPRSRMGIFDSRDGEIEAEEF